MGKPDFLKDCISDPALVTPGQPVPIDAFVKHYCIRCGNRACERAGSNNMAFDKRVQNWHENLFVNPPRADDSDTSFSQIRAKNFAPSGPKLEVQGSSGFVTIGKQNSVPSIPVPTITQVEPLARVIQPVEVLEPVVVPEAQIGASNTPFKQGTLLPGAPPLKEIVKEVAVKTGVEFTFDE